MQFSWQISKYIVRAILPYLGVSWLLLSVILFVQQASRYSDIFFSNSIPAVLVWQLTLALIPNVVAFTCPMAVLIGVIIGLSKLQGDSELVAIRAAGIGNLQITIPIIILGILFSGFAFFINLKGVPFAAQIVRKIAVQTALYKLESPIEPGVFNTEIQDYTIYVKDGDIENGTWKNIFIFREDKNTKEVRLITANGGRIDSINSKSESVENSELVLTNATVNTFSFEDPTKKLISEKVNESRLVIKTKRAELIAKLSKSEEEPEELGLDELKKYAESKTGKDKTEALILWHRRILLSFTPLIFALLGTSLVLRFNRGGRGWGIILALISLVVYYLVALFGEQLARTDKITVFAAGMIPIVLTSLAIFWFFLSQRLYLAQGVSFFKGWIPSSSRKTRIRKPKTTIANLTTGILDFDIITALLKYFLLTFSFLTSIYMIFTAFELWKFAGTFSGGIKLLGLYLAYLVPFIYIQISPSALMIATLATYLIKSRQNEVVTWTAAGRSIYRLLFPCFILMMLIGGVNWVIQERVLPETNVIQDNLRTQIRSKGIMSLNNGKNWVASDKNIYSFTLTDDAKNDPNSQGVKDLVVYQFDQNDYKLLGVLLAEKASWSNQKIAIVGNLKQITWENGIQRVSENSAPNQEIKENYNPFTNLQRKPNHLAIREIRDYIDVTESENEKRAYMIALAKRYTIPFLPLIITLFTAPFALSLHRQGKVVTLGYAVAVWLLFMGVSNVFEQYGLSGLIEPNIAVWGPLAIFSIVGLFFLSRVKT